MSKVIQFVVANTFTSNRKWCMSDKRGKAKSAVQFGGLVPIKIPLSLSHVSLSKADNLNLYSSSSVLDNLMFVF